MLEQRKTEVLDAYQRLKKSGKLSVNLLHPTTAKLRNECAAVFHHRPDNKIKSTLQSFARVGFNIKNVEDILTLDTDKFKPLLNFMNDEISSPNPQNVELLAWLIEYNENSKIASRVGFRFTHWLVNDVRRVSILIVFLILIGTTIYIYLNRYKCMAWNGVEFKKVACEESVLKGQHVIAIERSRLSAFKRITQPDTLTYHDINKTWYTKLDTFPEFYTQAGMHPVDTERRLKPVSKYIIDKYILRKIKDTAITTLIPMQ